MGSPAGERQRHEDERAHRVALSPFYLSPYEVTQAEYESVMGANPSHFTGDNLPVETVTWYDAAAYCNALSEREGLTPAYTVSGGGMGIRGARGNNRRVSVGRPHHQR